jgi:outer membrane usher protein
MWCRSLVGAALLAWSLTASAALSALVADVTVNGTPGGVAVLMEDDHGDVYASAETLEGWRVAAPRPQPADANGNAWYPLAAFPGIELTLDRAALTLDVRVPPELLPETRIGGPPEMPPPSPPGLGAFLDYQWGYAAPAGDESPDILSLSLDPTIFSPAGNFYSGLIWRESLGNDRPSSQDDGWLRLDTTWTMDDPEDMTSLRVGDSVTIGSSWQRSLRYGGVQLARNFGTRPRMTTVPQPAVRGTAVLPTTVEILVDGQSRSAAELPPGSWALERIPVTAGAGELTVVTTDLAGRRQEQVLDFYASPRQLRPGLTDFGISVGWTRENFGYESFDYGEAFAALTYRRGQTDRLTWEAGTELSGSFANTGLGAGYSWPRVGLASVAVASSRDEDGNTGALWQVGFERRSRGLSLSAGLQGASRGFRQLGYDKGQSLLKRQSLASAGMSLGALGSLSLTFARQERFDAEAQTFSQLGLTRTTHGGTSVSAFWRHTAGADSGSAFGLNVYWRIGERSSAGTSVAAEDGEWDVATEYRRDLPLDEGLGYRVRSTAGSSQRNEVTINANTEHVRWDGDMRHSDAGTEWAAFAQGSVVWLGSLHAARQVRDSFAIVDPAGVEDVRVYWENQEVGRTDESGRLLVPLLRPFDANKLAIDVRDLPIATTVERSSVQAVPFGRSGLLVSFGVRQEHPATLRLVRPDGSPVPAGAVAQRPGVEGVLPVGYDGRLYLPATSGGGEVHVRWNGQTCVAILPQTGSAGPVPHLGDATCEAVQ